MVGVMVGDVVVGVTVGRVGDVVVVGVTVGRAGVAAAVEGEIQWRHFFPDPEESSPVPHHACKWP